MRWPRGPPVLSSTATHTKVSAITQRLPSPPSPPPLPIPSFVTITYVGRKTRARHLEPHFLKEDILSACRLAFEGYARDTGSEQYQEDHALPSHTPRDQTPRDTTSLAVRRNRLQLEDDDEDQPAV
jgi:hypothetical protein